MKFSLERSVEILSATPATVRSMVGNLSECWTSSVSREDWGPFDIIGHLIHGELTDWILGAKIILDQAEDRRFEPFDRLAQFEVSKGKTLQMLLTDFELIRRENLETLLSWDLSDDQLDLEGIHPELGNVTLRQLLATWVVHDLTHIRQIATSMAKRYDPSWDHGRNTSRS
jgi:hypothetical protein